MIKTMDNEEFTRIRTEKRILIILSRTISNKRIEARILICRIHKVQKITTKMNILPEDTMSFLKQYQLCGV